MAGERIEANGGYGRDNLIFEIASKVATRTGSKPNELAPPLGAVIDGDALMKLVDSNPDDLRISFHYHGHEIVIEAGDDATIRTSLSAE